MRSTLKPVALLLACSLSAAPLMAQSAKGQKEKQIAKDETVIIRGDKSSGETVIEIRDGKVYVDGDAVASVEDVNSGRVHKKVIIEHGEGARPDRRGFRYFEDEGPARGGRRAMLGVLTDPTSDKAGALVKEVTPGSAAEKAGLQDGDLITRVDGKSIKDAQALVAEIMSQHEPGDKVSIEYERDGKERKTSATLQSAGPSTAMRSFRFPPNGMPDDNMPNSLFRSFPFLAGDDDFAATPKLGVGVEDRADGDGVRVLSVKPGSAAASAGLREGDVITRMGDEKVGSVDELQMSLRDSRAGEKLRLEYQRAGKAATAEVTLPKTVKRRDL